MSIRNSSDTKRSSYNTKAERWIVSSLTPCLGDHEPMPQEIGPILRDAKEAGLDWEDLYKQAVWLVSRNSNRSFPSVQEVDPSNYPIPTVPDNVQLDENDPEYLRRRFVEWLKSVHNDSTR